MKRERAKGGRDTFHGELRTVSSELRRIRARGKRIDSRARIPAARANRPNAVALLILGLHSAAESASLERLSRARA